MDEAMAGYDNKKVHRLLTETFSEEELRDFCFYEAGFRPVHDALRDTDRKGEILRRLIDYAGQKGLIEQLLDWAKATNLTRYQAYAPYQVDHPAARQAPPPATPSAGGAVFDQRDQQIGAQYNVAGNLIINNPPHTDQEDE